MYFLTYKRTVKKLCQNIQEAINSSNNKIEKLRIEEHITIIIKSIIF